MDEEWKKNEGNESDIRFGTEKKFLAAQATCVIGTNDAVFETVKEKEEAY